MGHAANRLLRVNQEGVELIKAFEGFREKAYDDNGSAPGGTWTVGYGHTRGVYPGMHITPQMGETYLKEDLGVAEDAIKYWVSVPLTSNQFSALCSFVFNVGAGAFRASSILHHLNEGDYDGACERLALYKYASGKIEPGLIRRRAAEQVLFRKP